MARKLSETVQLKLRFREELRRKLEKTAERNNQSINSEIVSRLEGSFSIEDKVALAQSIWEEQIAAINQAQNELSGRLAREQQERIEQQTRWGTVEAIVHTLLGNNDAAKQAVRSVTLLLATKPWLAEEVASAIKSIEGRA